MIRTQPLLPAAALMCGLSLPLAQADEAAAPAPAEAAAPAATRIEAVVVTASKRQGYVNAIPTSISAYGGEDLKAAGIEDTRDLAKLVPGFSFADSGFGTPIYTLRGVGFADSSFAATSTVGVYADEVSLAYPVMTKGPDLDLRRVEILKGPQGTLYGRNSTGGTINYVPNAPTPRFTAGAEAGFGSFGRFDAEAFVSGPITDTLRGRFAASTTNSTQGWQNSQTRPGDTLGKQNKQAARGILDWQPLDDFSLRFTLSGWRDGGEPQAPYALALQPQNPFFGQAGLSPAVRAYPLNPDNRDPRAADWNPKGNYGLHDNFWLASLRPVWTLTDDIKLTGLFSYAQVRADGSKLPQGGLNVEDIDQQLFAYIRSYSGELRLSGNLFTDRGDWVVGVNGNYDRQHEVIVGYGSENSLNVGLFGSTPPLFKPIFFQAGAAKSDVHVRSGSAFADGSLKLLESLKLTLGVRYTQEGQDYAGCTYVLENNDSIIPFPYFTLASTLKGGNSVVAQGQCGSLDANANAGLYTGELNEHSVSYRSVLSWTPLKDALFYGSYTRGYKAGGFPTVFSVDQASLAPVVQERLDAYEVGSKLTLFDRSVQLNAAAFHYDYRNKQLLTYFRDPIFGALQYLQNVPRSLVEGGELSATWIPLDKLYLTALGSWIRTKVIEYQGLTSQGTAFDFAGQPFNYTPRLQATLLANYTFRLNSTLNVSPGASFTYTGSTNATLEHDPLFALNGHRIFDARLAFSPPNREWILDFYGRNLGNAFYKGSVIKLGDSVFAYTGAPRVIGVNLTYTYR